MASHKTLKSVVRSLAESFTSLMNYSGDDYVLGHLVYTAWKTGATTCHVDLINGLIDPSPLVIPPVQESIMHYVRWLPDLVNRSQSEMSFIASAELVITIDPNNRWPYRKTNFQESPFSCAVRIMDDRGKIYAHRITGWWYPEKKPPDKNSLKSLASLRHYLAAGFTRLVHKKAL